MSLGIGEGDGKEEACTGEDDVSGFCRWAGVGVVKEDVRPVCSRGWNTNLGAGSRGDSCTDDWVIWRGGDDSR